MTSDEPTDDGPASDEDAADRHVRDACTRRLSGHHPQTMADRLRALADHPSAAGAPDVYGSGGPVQELEERVAGLLGKPAGRFVIKGVIAQQAALRAWCERRGSYEVVLHPQSHVAFDEDGAFERLHPMRGVRLGAAGHFTVADLDAVAGRVGVVTVELPLRRAGFRLPAWGDLVAISTWCREHDVPLHLDGARLWEAAAGYERELAEVAALADSVYVSFYKGIGGLAGCVLAGEEDLLAEATPWASRLGANVFATYPSVLSALDGLDRQLPRMTEFRDRAARLAGVLDDVPGVVVSRSEVNAFVLHLPGRPGVLRTRHRAIAAATGTWFFGGFAPSTLSGRSAVEVAIGEAADAVTDAEVREAVSRLLAG